MDRQTFNRITRWTLRGGAAQDAAVDRLRDVLLDPSLLDGVAAEEPAGGASLDLPLPTMDTSTGIEPLHDALAALLQRFMSPAREGDPRLLAEALDLAARLEAPAAREVVAGLLIGGAYREMEVGGRTLEARMVDVLRATTPDEAQRAAMLEAIAGLVGDPAEPSPAGEGDAGGVSSADDEAGAGADIIAGDQVPQVNDPDQVFAFIDALGEGIEDRKEYARHARVSVRQADFIARAASSLGLVQIHPGGHYELLDLARSLPRADDPAGREARHRIVGDHPLLRALDLQVSAVLPDLAVLEDLLSRRTELGPGTIRRRAQALRRWVEWWASGGR